MKLQTRIILGYIAVCLIWGTSWSAIKIGLESFPPILFAAYRFSFAAFSILFFLRRDFFTEIKEPKFWGIVSILSVLAFAIPIALMNSGQTIVSSSLASVLFATYPLWVGIASHFMLPNDRLSISKAVGIFLAFVGVLVLFQPTYGAFTQTFLLGMFAILASAFLQALSLVLIRKYAQSFSSLNYNFLAMILSALLLFILSSHFETSQSQQITVNGVLAVLFLGFFATAGTFVIYFWLTKHLSPVVLSLTAFITPILAIFLGVFLLDEQWTSGMTLGTSAILVGVIVTLIDQTAVQKILKQDSGDGSRKY